MPKFFEKLDKLEPIFQWIYKICMFLCKIFLVADLVITALTVANRYLLKLNMSWTEQMILTLMSYMAVLSAALAIHKGSHIRMNAFDRYIPKNAIKVLDVMADIAVLALGVIMLVHGWTYALSIGKVGNYEAIPWLSRFWMYFPIPLAGIFMILFELESIVNHLKAFWIKEEE